MLPIWFAVGALVGMAPRLPRADRRTGRVVRHMQFEPRLAARGRAERPEIGLSVGRAEVRLSNWLPMDALAGLGLSLALHHSQTRVSRHTDISSHTRRGDLSHARQRASGGRAAGRRQEESPCVRACEARVFGSAREWCARSPLCMWDEMFVCRGAAFTSHGPIGRTRRTGPTTSISLAGYVGNEDHAPEDRAGVPTRLSILAHLVLYPVFLHPLP